MKKKKKWLKPLIILVVLAALACGIYYVATEVFVARGVQATTEDIMAVVIPCMPYIIGIASVLVLWLIIGIATIFLKKQPLKLTIRWQSLVAGLIAIVIIANMICYGPVNALLNVAMAAKGEMNVETRDESYALAKQIAEEGIVLLKNEDGALPLKADVKKLNVFGWGATNPIYGGTGSGAFNDTSNMVSLLDGLRHAGYELNQDVIDFLVKEEDTRPEIGMYIQDWTNPEAKVKDMNRKKLFDGAKEFSDTTLLVISRSGGENADLPMSITDENSIAQAATTGRGVRYTSQKDDIDPSKHYLELTAREIALLERLNEDFENIIVVINSANTMELGWVDQYENVKGVVWCAGAGQSGFEALGEVISGAVNPSGRTADTYVYDLLTIPMAKNIGTFEYDNVADFVNTDASTNYSSYFLNYVEGIYVGYKFYETAAAEGLINYDEVVQYPFGYGLSYTDFTQELISCEEKDGTVTVKVKVTNNGSVAGKEVVQVYYNPPYYNGGIEKASVNLIEFAKTQMLEPGASEEITVSFTLEDMASYDENVNKCYVLERGDYVISIRKNSHTEIASKTITVDKDVIYNASNPRSTDKVAATNLFDYADGGLTYLSRKDGFANYAEATAAPATYSMSDEVKALLQIASTYNAAEDTDPNAKMPNTGKKNGLTLADMAGVAYDDEKWDKLLDQLTVAEMSNFISVGGYSTAAMASIDLDATIETDGPSGLHSNYTDLEGTSFPSPVMVASTWNKELARQRGELVGRQGQELGITGWYGPAMNIHRSGFSGRNFEYYSEDPILSGIMAVEETAGARKNGMQTYVKHFAMNDQESFRTGIQLVWSNEQAIRETYLKPFEMAIKEGGANSVMSSYNFIGHKWAGANPELLNDVLRGEWGFEGVVVTDWFGGYGYMLADLAIRNGGDRMLTTTGSAPLADTTSATGVSAMREACKNILYSLVQSNVVGAGNTTPLWKQILNGVNIGTAVLVLLLELVYILKLKKKSWHKVEA